VGFGVGECEAVDDADAEALPRDPVRCFVGVPIEIVGVGGDLEIDGDMASVMVCVADPDGLRVP
jgi:hypothetical protein